MRKMQKIEEKAKKALKKKAAYGEDIELEKFVRQAEPVSYADLDPEEQKRLHQTGLDLSNQGHSGAFFQSDCSVVHCQSTYKGLEVLPIKEAIQDPEKIKDYCWQAVSVDTDKYTAASELDLDNGYFIRALPGEKVIYPVQACLYIRKEKFAQHLHNIIIAEEGSELHIITGCATSPHLVSGLHIGVSEFYIKKGAKLTFTMIHNWGEDVYVRPRSGVIVEEDGVFISNYISLGPVRSLQTYPSATLAGRGALARFNSILVAPPGSELDIGAKVTLKAPEARAEIISRAISTGGKIIARGLLVGEVPGIKAHLECKGLILSEKGIIRAIPELEGQASGVDMSHEAAVGKIAQEEIEYLMARGLSEEEATSTIVRGFLNVQIDGLPAELQAEIEAAVKESEKALI
ncbi:MAG: SufD family Fe-S cluster assembly protein [Thermodesulfobacteriota bacterium]|nr:SufD family Fe-S cluster assembly protein [Thermodesulfobacteriota bacterium]